METTKNIDELKEYREKLSKLTNEESKKRDLYLKELAEGELEGPPTGFASIDKPWLKFYDKKNINPDSINKTIYECWKEIAFKNQSNIALNYMGIRITNRKKNQKIIETAKALKNLGVKNGDIISICSVNTPETDYLLYAANMIGAIVDLFDPRTNQLGIESYIKESNSKYLFVLDNFLEEMYRNVNNTTIQKIVHISPYDSIPTSIKILLSINKKNKQAQYEEEKINNVIYSLESNNGNVISWNKFINMGKKVKHVDTNKYTKDSVIAIVHTGGTTGLPKGVQLTNENFISQYLNYKSLDFDLKEKDKFLNVLVPWVAYGLVFSFFVIPALSIEHILIPSFKPEDLPQLIIKYKPNQVLGIPAYYETLINSEILKDKDLSFLKCVGSGGDHISPDLEKKLNLFLEQHNSQSKFVKGYGMTELSSSVCTCLKNINEIGSVGVPLVNNVIGIFDPETYQEKRIGEQGEICIKSPTMMKSYADSKKNEGVMIQHDDGKIWIHSGDIGYMTDKGSLYVVDRIKRMIIRQGFKVYPSEIEKVITLHHAIDFCAVVGVPNEKDVHTPKAFMVLNEKYIGKDELVLNEVKELLRKNLPQYEIPYDEDYEFIESIPHTSLGKVDFDALIRKEKIKKGK